MEEIKERDRFRTKAELKIYCSRHPKTEMSYSAKPITEANSAYEINIGFVVHPCRDCEMEHDQFRRSVSIVFERTK